MNKNNKTQLSLRSFANEILIIHEDNYFFITIPKPKMYCAHELGMSDGGIHYQVYNSIT